MRILMRDGKINRLLQSRGIHARQLRAVVLPFAAGREIGCGRREYRGEAEDKSSAERGTTGGKHESETGARVTFSQQGKVLSPIVGSSASGLSALALAKAEGRASTFEFSEPRHPAPALHRFHLAHELLLVPALHHLHHFLHLLELLDELVDLENLDARAGRDAHPAPAVEHGRIAALLSGHRLDDRLRAFHLL